ncbi:MAG: TrbC/VirB2 family protein [Alphaproteobacteria bacterium]|jgi:type IV secretory pathway VirB2 component (pilin)
MKNKNTIIGFGLLILLFPLLSYSASAYPFGDVGDLACAIARAVSSPIAKAIATIGIVFLGAKAFIGKLDWVTVLVGSLGIFIIFGFFPLINTIVSFTNDANAKTHVQDLCK